MIGSQDVIIALVIGLVLFGSKKLPELARGLGQSLKEFKKATSSEVDAETRGAHGALPRPPRPPGWRVPQTLNSAAGDDT